MTKRDVLKKRGFAWAFGAEKHPKSSHKFLEADLDPFMPSQVWDKPGHRRPATGEEKLAWRFLERNVLDVCQGPQRARLEAITELEAWMDAGENAPYSFDYWCGMLGVGEGFMRDKFKDFLREQRANALNGVKGDFHILKQIEAVRIDQPHRLSLDGWCGPQQHGHPDVYESHCYHGIDHRHPMYKCLSCGQRGDMSHFTTTKRVGARTVYNTCVRTAPTPPDEELWLQAGLESLAKTYEESHSQSLHASDLHSLQDQGSRPDQSLDNWDNEGGCSDGGGEGGASSVGAVVVGPAPSGSPSDV